jgi:hypothetical protein
MRRIELHPGTFGVFFWEVMLVRLFFGVVLEYEQTPSFYWYECA